MHTPRITWLPCHTNTLRLLQPKKKHVPSVSQKKHVYFVPTKKYWARAPCAIEVHVGCSARKKIKHASSVSQKYTLFLHFFFHLAPSVFQKHTSSVQTTTKKRIHHVSGLGQKHTSNKKTRCIARHRSMSRLLQSISSRLFFVLGAGDNQVNAEEMKARNTKISGKLMFSAKNGVLSAFLREDEATLRLR